MKAQFTDAEQARMLELDRIGTEHQVYHRRKRAAKRFCVLDFLVQN
jgi:hypothetical protein